MSPAIIRNRWETIRCPGCGRLQTARVEIGVPFDTYVHTCSCCGYVTIESEWDTVPGAPTLVSRPVILTANVVMKGTHWPGWQHALRWWLRRLVCHLREHRWMVYAYLVGYSTKPDGTETIEARGDIRCERCYARGDSEDAQKAIAVSLITPMPPRPTGSPADRFTERLVMEREA